ncbi:hypothetical protein DFQ26_000708 [Actinomortierella ambigua]|nr:hypothetical protein DFQ26_000708 [Actinomortierella ambigua]
MKLQISSIIGFMLLCRSANAAVEDCPAGSFCVWSNANYDGRMSEWPGDDNWWESWIADDDSSWANHLVSGPGIKDHVKVYEDPELSGDTTICLGPGQEVPYDAAANDRGNSHEFVFSC